MALRRQPPTKLKQRPEILQTLDVDLQHAALQLARAYEAIVARQLCKSQSYEPRVDGAFPAEIDDRGEELLRRYGLWRSEMQRRRLPVGDVIDMVVESIPPMEVDRRRGLAWGSAHALLLRSLQIWGDVLLTIEVR